MKRRSGVTVMARLIGLVKPLMGVMFFAVVTGLAGHLCASFITIFGGYAVLGLLGFDTPLSLRSIFGSVLVFAVLRSVLRYAEQSANHFIAFKLLARLRDKVFAALRKLCPAKLEGRDKGDLISVITSDIELLEVFYAHTISPAAIAFLYTIIMSLFIGSFHPALAALALLAYLTVGIVVPMITQNFGSKGQTTADAATTFRADSGNLSGFVLDNLRGLSETIQYGCGKERLIEMEKKTNALLESEKRIKCTTGRNMAVTNTIILAFDLCMLFVSAGLYQNGRLDFTGVVVPTIALFSSFAPSMALANLGSTLQNTFAAGNRVLGILDETPVVQEVRRKGRAAFEGAAAENVGFSYGTETILDGVSLQIPKREVVGIVGKSGSGKSTLLKLFMRFWEVRDGTVTISGKNINEVDTSQLRDMESFMTQETHLFQDSIKNNLRIAKLDATEEELEAACRKASVHDFIMGLPQGYDTPVGELGDTLSGGEKQRLGLARAFLHDASFLLLDEPTSNLDSLNEAVILKSLREERNGKTVLLVSHRQSTMRIADTIYDMESLSKTKGQVS
ncbi:MAG: ABC transporter ATP-binding protein [Lachnospiraceae bacterium]|nr:ABC transporter ATP-binding protein [Lachnospiraceae bacterium]